MEVCSLVGLIVSDPQNFLQPSAILYPIPVNNVRKMISNVESNRYYRCKQKCKSGTEISIVPCTSHCLGKGSDWIRLVFAHPFPLNSEAPIASANLISDGKVQVSPSYTLKMELAQLMGAPLFKTNRWAQWQSNCFSSQSLWIQVS